MKFTDNEYNEITGVIDEIRKIIRNSSSSSLSVSLIKVLNTIGKKYWPSLCHTCSAGRFNLVSRIHTHYNLDTNERNKIEKEEICQQDHTQAKTGRKIGRQKVK